MNTKDSASDFAVIATGGKQYVVRPGKSVQIEKLPQTEGAVEFRDILLRVKAGAVSVGIPHVTGATVTGTIIATAKGKKVRVVHYKAKTRQHRSRGHRQIRTTVRIESV